MIKVQNLIDCDGADKYGTCASCGESSSDDKQMVKVTFLSIRSNHGMSFCLCNECRNMLSDTLRVGCNWTEHYVLSIIFSNRDEYSSTFADEFHAVAKLTELEKGEEKIDCATIGKRKSDGAIDVIYQKIYTGV